MIYKLDITTGAISEVSDAEARRALESYGWSDWIIRDFFHSAKTLYTAPAFFCRFRMRLEEVIDELRPSAPSPYGTAEIMELCGISK